MREITLQAEIRKQTGKGSRALRRQGKVPGIYYISGENTIPVTVEEKSLKPLIYTSETHVINLTLENGEVKNCILRDIQFDPLTDRPIHIDLQGLREDREITVEVPVVITGAIPVGVRDGGILQGFMHRLRISSLPKNIPEHIEINAEMLKVNQFIHVSDLKIESVKVLENATSAIVGVIPPTVEKEVAATTATPEAPLEPEVIGKGKKVDEEGGAAPPAGAAAATAAPPEEKKKK
ncbi:MAG: 50S ribosomal protein L25 [Bacteroidota bacterium]